MTERFFGNWKNLDDVIGSFDDVNDWDENKDKKIKARKRLPEWKGVKILFAAYAYGDYDGDSLVIFTQNGKLYEVNASHCSCHGLEGQWHPEETTIESITHRLNEGSTYGIWQDFNNEIRKCIGEKTVNGYVMTINVSKKKNADKIKQLLKENDIEAEIEVEKV